MHPHTFTCVCVGIHSFMCTHVQAPNFRPSLPILSCILTQRNTSSFLTRMHACSPFANALTRLYVSQARVPPPGSGKAVSCCLHHAQVLGSTRGVACPVKFWACVSHPDQLIIWRRHAGRCRGVPQKMR